MKKTKTFGQYIVADPLICHGQLTFRGTRMLVADVLELVAEAKDWNYITKQCHGNVSRAAIAEAIRFAGREFSKSAGSRKKAASA